MNKSSRLPLIIVGLAFLVILAFFAGAFSYRAGLLTKIRARLLPQDTQTPAPPTPEVETDFSLSFLKDPSTASMNAIPLAENQKPLKFLVSGHVYGKPGDEEFHPAATLITNLALLRDLDPDFVVFLGDTVWKPTKENFNTLDHLVLTQFNAPVFNAVGNHDVSKREVYQERYGGTVFAFRYKEQLFFILDTTLQYYDLNDEQLEFIKNTIDQQMMTSETEAIYLFMHHVLFLDQEEISGKQLLKPNEGDGRSDAFHDFLGSTLQPLSQNIPVYIFAGDVGAFKPGNLSPFYKKEPGSNITFIATGLGSHQNDSILLVEEDLTNKIIITPISLTGRNMKSLDSYNFQYWSNK